MPRRHRKSPGSHTRWSQGRHGSSPTSTVSTAAAPPRHGPQTAGVVGPKSTTIGVAVVAATCAGPLSPPRNRLARAIRPRSSPSPRSQATAMAPASTPRPSASAPHLLGPRRLRRTGREDDTTIRLSGREPGRDVGERRFRPPPELVAGADVDDDELVGRARCRARGTAVRPGAGPPGPRTSRPGRSPASARPSSGSSAWARSHWFSTEWRWRWPRGLGTRVVYIQPRPAIV